MLQPLLDRLRRIKPLHLVLLAAALVLVGLSLFLLLRSTTPAPVASLDNQMPQLGSYAVNPDTVAAFLKRQGYTDRVSRALVRYTDAPQKVLFGQAAPDGSTLYTIGAAIEEGVVTVELNYNPDHFDTITGQPDWQGADFLTGICLALLTDITPDAIDGCYQEVHDFIIWATDQGLPSAITPAPQRGWRLVTPAYAACNGVIPCGRDARRCTCTGNPSKACTPALPNPCDQGEGTCTCGPYYCDESYVNNCSRLDNQTSCNICGQSGYDCCDNKCTLSPPRPDPGTVCSWTTSPPPPPPPPPLPDFELLCTASRIDIRWLITNEFTMHGAHNSE